MTTTQQNIPYSLRRNLSILIMVVVSAITLYTSSVVSAEDLEHPAELTNWAYAAFQGSGIYKISDRTIGVLSLPLSYSLDPNEFMQGKGILEITYPIILGVYDFDVTKYGFDHLADRLGTVSFVPGLHYHYSVYDSWLVTPFIDAGAGMNMSESGYSWIYSVGLESRYFFDISETNFMLGNRLRWAGYTVGNTGNSDDYVSFKTILEYLLETPWTIFNRKVDYTLYGSNQLNFDAKVLHHYTEDHPDMKAIWEVGATVGFVTANEEDFLHTFRMGVGYQFGGDVKAVTFVIGDVF